MLFSSVDLLRRGSAPMVGDIDPICLVTGRICRKQLCRYCFYSRADFEVFRPAGATRCTDQGQIWQGGADLRRTVGPLLPAKFVRDRFRGGGLRPQN